MDLSRFKKLPIMGILRGIDEHHVEPLMGMVMASGLETIEITMNTANAPRLIRKAVKFAGKSLVIGAGTVLTVDDAIAALDAGATFIVSPVLVPPVMEYCRKYSIPVFPGAFSPQEIYNAWRMEAAMVKVFPAKMLGPDYFKEIKGPFKDIELLACSGVTPENMNTYLASGASAVSFGASVFKKEWLEKEDYKSIGEAVKRYVGQISIL